MAIGLGHRQSLSCAMTPWLKRKAICRSSSARRLRWQHHAGCRTVRAQLSISICQPSLSRSYPGAGVDDFTSGGDWSRIFCHWPEIRHLQVHGSIAGCRRKRRVDGQPHHRIEQRGRVAAMYRSKRIVVILGWVALHDDLAMFGRTTEHPHRPTDAAGKSASGERSLNKLKSSQGFQQFGACCFHDIPVSFLTEPVLWRVRITGTRRGAPPAGGQG